MISKFANLFIWWKGQTIGTSIYTKLFGVFIGKDEFGNTYFTTSDGKKRWVNYKGDCNATSISPVWHNWLHKTTNNLPSIKEEVKNYNKVDLNFTQKKSKKPYHPNNFKKNSLYDDYTPWKP